MNIARPGDIRCSKVFSERAKNVEKRVKRIAGGLVLTVLIILPAGCADLRQQAEGGGDRAFRAYTEELFRESVSSDTISLHYTLKEPENFGITEDGALAGSFTSDPDAVRASAENMNEALKKYAAQYGPLTIDTGDDTCSRQWDWVMQPWPWEGVC